MQFGLKVMNLGPMHFMRRPDLHNSLRFIRRSSGKGGQERKLLDTDRPD